MNGKLTEPDPGTTPVEPIGKLGGYELLEILSRSIVTTVYRAWQPTLNRPVLLKQLHPQLAIENDIRARFEREARVIARVRHDNIVAIHDFSTDPEAVFLVLEWIDGYNLSQILKRGGSLPAPIAALVILEILKGLEIAHNQEVIHRDIKPENILISKDGRIKISDFGLALFKESPTITQQGMVIGTPSFMAPETITGGTVDPRTDLFALGATFYELLTGERVFSGATFQEVLHLVLSKMPPKPSTKVRDIPPEVDKLVIKLLEKDARNRPANATEVITQLRAILAVYQWPENPLLIRDYIADPAGFRMPRAHRSKLRRGRSIVAWGIVLFTITVVAMFFHNRLLSDNDTQMQLLNRDPAPVDTIKSVMKVDSAKPDTMTPTPSTTETKPSSPVTEPTKRASDLARQLPRENQSASSQTTPVNPPASEVTGTGLLRVSSEPWATLVSDDGVRESLPTAEPLSLQSGNRVLTFLNPKFPPVVKHVRIKPGETERLHVVLWDEVGKLRIGQVIPWADVLINGVKVATTPLAEPLPVAPGTVKITLSHPKYAPKQFEYTLAAGQESERMSWNFESGTP